VNPKNRISHLYKITDTKNNKFYVGKHLGSVQGKYWGSGKYLKRHIAKHGLDSMKYEILAIGTEEYIYNLESTYITKEFLKENDNCMNIMPGGKIDCSAKCGASLGRVASNKGKKTPDEVRLKQRLAKLGKPGARKGMKHSPETIEKMRLAKLGKKTSDETKKKLSKFQLKRYEDPLQRQLTSQKITLWWNEKRKVGT
jgi:hypothetical protein